MQLNFDARNVDPSHTYDPIPAGWYNGMITESELKPTKDNSGAYLELKVKILDGPQADRVLFDRLNLKNSNPAAQEIAYKRLSAICHAIEVMQVADSKELHGKPFKIKVKVRQADGQYDASNEIAGYESLNSPPPRGFGGMSPPAALAPAPALAAPPVAPANWGASSLSYAPGYAPSAPATPAAPSASVPVQQPLAIPAPAPATPQAPPQLASATLSPPAQANADVPPWLR